MNALICYTGESQSTGVGFRKVKGTGWFFGLFTLCGFIPAGLVGNDETVATWIYNRKRRECDSKRFLANRRIWARKQAMNRAIDWREIIANK